MLFERSGWAAGDGGSVGLAVSEMEARGLSLPSSMLEKPIRANNGVVVSGGNSGLGQGASDGRDSD